MPILQKIISDITEKEIKIEEVIKIYKSFFDYVNEKSLNINAFHIDICNDCIKKYFEKYISYNDYE